MIGGLAVKVQHSQALRTSRPWRRTDYTLFGAHICLDSSDRTTFPGSLHTSREERLGASTGDVHSSPVLSQGDGSDQPEAGTAASH